MGYQQDGIVLVGDAFATSCPAAGTGVRRVLVDVERLCNVHIPQWLATPGMGAAKIASFYADEIKVANDVYCVTKAFQLRSLSTDTSLPWVAQRWARFVLHAATDPCWRALHQSLPRQRAKIRFRLEFYAFVAAEALHQLRAA